MSKKVKIVRLAVLVEPSHWLTIEATRRSLIGVRRNVSLFAGGPSMPFQTIQIIKYGHRHI